MYTTSIHTRLMKRYGEHFSDEIFCTLFIATQKLPLLILFCVRLCRQQPIKRTFNKTNAVPEATPTNNSMPDVLPAGVTLVVGGPPSDDAG